MAQALGADLAHMDATEVAFLIDPQQTVRGILVNGRGQRYVAEDMYSGRIGQVTLYHQDDTAYLIIDGDAQEEAMAATSATPFLKRPADVGLRHGGRTRRRNRSSPRLFAGHGGRVQRDGAARGEDPLLHKKPEWLKPIGTPVGAIDLRASCAGFTLGGLQTTLDGEVLHVAGKPIPGLYAAGPLHGGSRGVGLRQRRLARRRQLLRTTSRTRGRQGLILPNPCPASAPADAGLLCIRRVV